MKSELRNRGLNCVFLRSLWLPLPLLLLWFNIERFVSTGETSIEPTVESILGHIFTGAIFIVIPLAYVVVSWVYVAQGWPMRGIADFCNQTTNPDAMMARVEKIWSEGFRNNRNFRADFRADDEYLIWASKISAGVIPLKDVLWASADVVDFPRVSIMKQYFFTVYTADGKFKSIRSRKHDGPALEDYLRKNFPDIVVGSNTVMKNFLEGPRWKEKNVEGAKRYIRERREDRKARENREGRE